eukprot:GFUD01138573.1.p1 GENE.GFUD01138573.1~~GFUD01138573.1.p1  ORF type:complete len:1018 (+),score=307.35 GFUD01138573.1:120-3173(+)
MDTSGFEMQNLEKTTDVLEKKHPAADGDSEQKKISYDDEHTISLEELKERLETDYEAGLTKSEAADRLENFGPNSLTPPSKTPEWLKFCKTMFTGFAMLLWIAAILCFMAYGIDAAKGDPSSDNLYVGGALTFVVVVSGIFTYYQENKSTKIMESFAKMIPPHARVLREGNVFEIDATELVVGDIVDIQGGDKTPADLRMIESHGVKVDNSSLTGESVPVALKPNIQDPNHLESKNLAFYSTNVVEGKGRGVVVKTGDDTVMGSIAGLVATLESGQTPINKEIQSFVHLISAIAVFIGVVFFIIAMAMGYDWIEAVIFFIGIIVANVPEGLLVTVTVTLTLTAKRMAAKNCLVKNLEGVETLGSTSVICSDKTGTLTQNKMTVAHMWLNMELVTLETGKKNYAENFDPKSAGWKELGRVACLCSNSVFLDKEENWAKGVNDRDVDGDATEAGILKCYECIMGDTDKRRGASPKLIGIPFNSRNKYQASVHVDEEKHVLVMKGAPEIVFDKCETILIDGKDVKIDETIQLQFKQACEELAGMGERVLAFVDLPLDPKKFPPSFVFSSDEEEPNFPLDHLRFVGLMSMIDPPKATVPEAVAQCKSAGIKVIMVTGDHPITAQAIAKEVGIISPDKDLIIFDTITPIPSSHQTGVSACVPGYVMVDWEEEDLDKVIMGYSEIAFARTSPKQKIFIVEGYQRAGNVVAVTGDGVNDSPALKKGDIGVAMGISGSEVSKEAADMILLDDDFATIVNGVEEGRLIFDNLKKSIVYTLTSNIPEIFPFLTWVVLGIPLPLSTVAILLIDLGTDMVPAISLAYEKAELDIMKRPPRSQQDRLVNHRLIFLAYAIVGITQAAAGFFVYAVIMASYGWMPLRLVGIKNQWEDEDNNALEDSWGQQWSYGQRMMIQQTCNGAYFLAIVQVQWADVIISKTRVLSIFQQGMNNMVLNFAMVFETALAALVLYLPYVPQFVGLYPIAPEWWIPALPFTLLIWVIDETRRFFIRRADTSAIGKFLVEETYY